MLIFAFAKKLCLSYLIFNYVVRTNAAWIQTTFYGEDEVRAVRTAYAERNQRLRDENEADKITIWHRKVASWSGVYEKFFGSNPEELLESLADCGENTIQAIDSILGMGKTSQHLKMAAERHEAGAVAGRMALELSFQVMMLELVPVNLFDER